jgi:hypothetical protein
MNGYPGGMTKADHDREYSGVDRQGAGLSPAEQYALIHGKLGCEVCGAPFEGRRPQCECARYAADERERRAVRAHEANEARARAIRADFSPALVRR